MMEYIKQYMYTGTSKSTFSLETENLLSELENTERRRIILNFQDFFQHIFLKLNKYLNVQHVYNFYKATHLFDLCITHEIDSFAAIKDLQDPSVDFIEEIPNLWITKMT